MHYNSMVAALTGGSKNLPYLNQINFKHFTNHCNSDRSAYFIYVLRQTTFESNIQTTSQQRQPNKCNNNK